MRDTAILARLRARAGLYLTDSCDVWRNTPTTSAYLTVQDGWAVIATGVACRIMPVRSTSDSPNLAGREATSNSYYIALPDTQDVRGADRIKSGGNTYEIKSIYVDQSDAFFIRCEVVLIDE